MEIPVYPRDFKSAEAEGFTIQTDDQVNEEVKKALDEYLEMPLEDFPDVFGTHVADVGIEIDTETGRIAVSRIVGIAPVPADILEKLRAKLKESQA